MATLEALARSTRDVRIGLLASAVRSDALTVVVEKVNLLIARLRAEQEEDLAKKENCEQTRTESLSEAIVQARAADEANREIHIKEEDVARGEEQITRLEKQAEQAERELQRMQKQRSEENAAFLESKRDLEEARSVVLRARGVLAGFYANNSLMLAQGKAHGAARAKINTHAPGQAPLPAPPTSSAPYGGRTQQSTSIISAMDMIAEDLARDLALATREEAVSLAAYRTASEELIAATEKYSAAAQTIDAENVRARGRILNLQTDSAQAVGANSREVTLLHNTQTSCEFWTEFFGHRRALRLKELDGLRKAADSLSGASYSPGPLQARHHA